jgi:hypothetical protein
MVERAQAERARAQRDFAPDLAETHEPEGRAVEDALARVGRRRDRLRKVGSAWKIVRREIYLDHTVLKSKNLSTFF